MKVCCFSAEHGFEKVLMNLIITCIKFIIWLRAVSRNSYTIYIYRHMFGYFLSFQIEVYLISLNLYRGGLYFEVYHMFFLFELLPAEKQVSL